MKRYWMFLILCLFCQTALGQFSCNKRAEIPEITNSKELKLFEKKAKRGDAQAQLCVGYYYHNKGKYEKAKEWFLKVSEGYDKYAADACCALLWGHYNWTRSHIYKQKAIELYKEEDTGHANYAIAGITYLYRNTNSERLLTDYNSVIHYLERAKNKDYPVPDNLLEKMRNERSRAENVLLEKGNGMLQKVLESYEYITFNTYPKNEMFSTIEYCHTLFKHYGIERAGVMFDKCRFIIREREGYEEEAKWIVKTASQWYINAAQQGDPEAQYMLGWWYATVDYPNYEKYKEQSEEWFEKSAKGSYAAAQYEVGKIRLRQKLYGDAFLWFQRAAAQGDKDGERMLAECYSKGQGTSRDLKKAVAWYRQAASQGDENAKSAMIAIYKSGQVDASKYNSFEAWYANIPSIKGGSVSVPEVEQGKAVKVDLNIDVDINIPVSSTSNDKTFAVIIGNENYQKVAKVTFAQNDARIFAKYCQNALGVPAKNVRFYTDASYGAMMSALKDIKQIAVAYKGDINVIFYYAGHGVPDETSHNAFLLPVDVDGSQTDLCLSINKLYQELNSLNARKVVVFMDACFSGSQRGEGMLASARGVALKVKNETPQGNMVVFTAATGDQTAYPFQEKGHGLFTYFLLRKLQDTKGEATVGEIVDYVSEHVIQQSVVVNRKSQTPAVFPSASIGEAWKTMKLNR